MIIIINNNNYNNDNNNTCNNNNDKLRLNSFSTVTCLYFKIFYFQSFSVSVSPTDKQQPSSIASTMPSPRRSNSAWSSPTRTISRSRPNWSRH